MTRHSCADCGDQIPNGRAHIRSINFRQVAFCALCWWVRTAQAKEARRAA